MMHGSMDVNLLGLIKKYNSGINYFIEILQCFAINYIFPKQIVNPIIVFAVNLNGLKMKVNTKEKLRSDGFCNYHAKYNNT